MTSSISHKWIAFWIANYIVLVAAIVGGMFVLRDSALTNLNTGTAKADWNQWRAAAAKETGETGPVQRSAPKSAEPPMLVLMRDHFAAAVVGLLAPVTALYVFLAWVITGIVRQSRSSPTVPVGKPRTT